MIDTRHLLPPDRGPRSNPVLHGIAEAIAKLCPLIAPVPQAREETAADGSTTKHQEPAKEAEAEGEARG